MKTQDVVLKHDRGQKTGVEGQENFQNLMRRFFFERAEEVEQDLVQHLAAQPRQEPRGRKTRSAH